MEGEEASDAKNEPKDKEDDQAVDMDDTAMQGGQVEDVDDQDDNELDPQVHGSRNFIGTEVTKNFANFCKN